MSLGGTGPRMAGTLTGDCICYLLSLGSKVPEKMVHPLETISYLKPSREQSSSKVVGLHRLESLDPKVHWFTNAPMALGARRDNDS